MSFVNFPENEQHQISSDLNADEDDGYCALNNDVKFWQAFTKEETKWYGAAVYWLLKRWAREDARGIFINDLKKDDGVEETIRILDKIP